MSNSLRKNVDLKKNLGHVNSKKKIKVENSMPFSNAFHCFENYTPKLTTQNPTHRSRMPNVGQLCQGIGAK